MYVDVFVIICACACSCAKANNAHAWTHTQTQNIIDNTAENLQDQRKYLTMKEEKLPKNVFISLDISMLGKARWALEMW